MTPDARERRLDTRLAAGATTLALVAALWPWVALPALVAVFLAGVATTGRARRVVVAAGGLLACVAFLRFVVEIAAPNVISAGQRSAEEKAVSRLRELLWAQDKARELGLVDGDRDGVAEFLTLPELAGTDTSRLARPLADPLLKRGLYRPDAAAPRIYRAEAYLFAVYPGGRPSPLPDETERRWVAYAWPAEPAHGGRRVFFIDQDENICETRGPPIYSGVGTIPEPTAALQTDRADAERCGRGLDGHDWRRWKGKRPRPAPSERVVPP